MGIKGYKMPKSKLAIFGGNPVRSKLFPNINTFDDREMNAIKRVMKRGRLSDYRGNFCDGFWGGPEVQQLEKDFTAKFGVKHAIACNSATSGLHAACGAIDLKPGDEVIVSPYSMTCSATAPMIFGATPVFADIEPDYYCISAESVMERITKKTKAIIPVSLFGQPYDPMINKIAVDHNLLVIEDAAQAIGSDFCDGDNFHYAGTLGDIGVFSFNYGKHLTCGEGGMILTDNDELAFKCRLMMNHAEAVVNGMIEQDSINYLKYAHMIGFNFRMTELNAAIVQEQFKKLNLLLIKRLANVQALHKFLEGIPAITFSKTRQSCLHSYYVCSFQWDSEKADGIHRDKFINAVKAELSPRLGRENEDVQLGNGYVKPLYLMPLFQRMSDNNPNYKWGSCPVAEELWQNKLFLTLYHAPNSTLYDMNDVRDAFYKVWEHRQELQR